MSQLKDEISKEIMAFATSPSVIDNSKANKEFAEIDAVVARFTGLKAQVEDIEKKLEMSEQPDEEI